MTQSDLTSRLDVIRATDKFDAHTIDSFVRFISSASDEELFRMSPIRYAERANLPKETAIDLFLYATHAGILNFNWGVICPSCGAFITAPSGLRWLNAEKRCTLCQLDTTPSLDERTEVAFTIAPLARAIRFHNMDELEFERDGFFIFFSTSVAFSPGVHRVISDSLRNSYRIPAESTQNVHLTLEADHYMLMVPATHAVTHIPVNNTVSTHEADIELLFDGQLIPETLVLAPGETLLHIHNRSRQPILLGLLREERMRPYTPEERAAATFSIYSLTPYLTGKQLVNSQTFRDLFHTESIPPAGGLELKNLTLLFTDLKGSTSIYERIGDFNAYALVREHFSLLREIIAARRGAIVKTMGDALMASFNDPASALEAAAAMNGQILKAGSGEELILKIGIHAGPCIAVETNEQLDYFGQTVNIAARVQAAAEAGEIVCTEAIYHASGVAEAIEKAGLQVHPDQALLKGVGNPVTFYRLR
jgi:class 3 adenylate cyclase